jgi:hypothetical protein
MADTIAVTEGAGKTVATKDIGGLQFQQVLNCTSAGAIVDPVAAGAAAVAAAVPVTAAKDEIKYVDVTLTLDTSAYGSGDLIADTQEVTAAFKANDALGVLHSVIVVDEDDVKAAIDLVFLSSNVSLGTENAAPSVTDANARNILGIVRVAAADYVDLGGVAIATKSAIGLAVKAGSGVDDMWVGVVSNASTPTYTASGLRLRIGVIG